jgi:hypothetical protein
MDDNEWEEMDANATSAICLNLLNEVIHNMIYEKKVETICQKLESVSREEFNK